jgi:hypothetical protein
VTDDSANKMIGEHSNVLIDRTPYRAIFPQMPADTRMGKLSHVTMARANFLRRSDTESPRAYHITWRLDFRRIGAISGIVIHKLRAWHNLPRYWRNLPRFWHK